MTTKDIRDIAAYWGTYSASYSHTSGKSWSRLLIDSEVLADLDSEPIYNFKIHLRPLTSLSDEEMTQTGRLLINDFHTRVDQAFQVNVHGIVPFFRVDFASGMQVQVRTTDAFRVNWSTWGDSSPFVAPAIAYLQSIGVYVPGTINPDFVQLIP